MYSNLEIGYFLKTDFLTSTSWVEIRREERTSKLLFTATFRVRALSKSKKVCKTEYKNLEKYKNQNKPLKPQY